MTCELCNGKQLIPFKRKDGTIVSNSFVDCVCKVEEPDHYRNTMPEDFDYPMSNSFREFTFEQYGQPSERRREIYQPDGAPVAKPAPQPWDQRQQYQIDQARAGIMDVRRMVQELGGKKLEPVKKLPPKKSNYNGLVIRE